MGVPAFYRWLVNKYPKIVATVIEDKSYKRDYVDVDVDVDLDLPNPNGLEFDHFYLDMNGIIHPCFHPHHNLIEMSPPTTFDQVFENIYAYIDRLVRIVRPRKLLYLAIDGVAPRAKMNQQRARRFRTAKDNEVAEEEERRLREEFGKKGKKLLPKLESQVSDSNVITPGTEFMHELSKALNLYIHRKLNNDPFWSKLEVILSDATVPGEGEHKVISFIRNKRSLPGYDPNTTHCLYGLDADLIMLALATHEFHFSILREDVLTVREEASTCESTLLSNIQNAAGNSLDKSKEDKPKPFFDIAEKKRSLLNSPQKYQFVHIWILREYLELDMQIIDPPEKFVFDIERIIDDFIFICFFVGNDFLPHMPTLDIHENAIDLLMYVYKKEFKSLGGYLVDMQRVNDHHAGYIKLKRVERFILSVGNYEEHIFKKRAEIRERKLRRMSSEIQESEADESIHEGFEGSGTDFKDNEAGNAQHNSSSNIDEALQNTKELNEKLKACIRKKSDTFRDGLGRDKVKLGTQGWKQRYYKEKFLVEDPKEVETLRKEIVHKYTEGLCWVLLYYFSGIPSWDWYYPYHYGPFASDLKGLAGVKVEFKKGLPFTPFNQLMAVLPPKSAHALPRVYQELMTDSNSDIIDFYPADFEVDVDGKRFQWQGICKLPFIDQEKLLSATRQLEQKLEEREAIRNVQLTDKMFIRESHSFDRELGDFLQQNTKIEDGIMCFNFELPVACLFVPRLLEGTQPLEKTIYENDIMETVLWHEFRGRPPVTRYRATPVDVGKDKAVNEASTNRPGWPGRGFEAAGRGKGIPSNASQGQCGYVRSTSALPLSVDRGMENMRVSPYHANRPYNNNASQNSFWPSRNGIPPHENASWRAVSRPRPPAFSGQPQFRPPNANASQFMGQRRDGGRGHSRPQMYNQYCTDQFMDRGNGRGRARPQMYSQYPTSRPDLRESNRW